MWGALEDRELCRPRAWCELGRRLRGGAGLQWLLLALHKAAPPSGRQGLIALTQGALVEDDCGAYVCSSTSAQ